LNNTVRDNRKTALAVIFNWLCNNLANSRTFIKNAVDALNTNFLIFVFCGRRVSCPDTCSVLVKLSMLFSNL
jgi:hypothetical protein